ncbi:MAG TPA: amidohydrolase family protein [Vicinamibacterales bacterium]|jgi:imidazolonepropionase-like amidohydrolase|nr:amidohydrolase family protein [Vicinamibacterales bacterium]
MHPKSIRLLFLVVLGAAFAQSAHAQTVAIRAGRLFDPKSGADLQNRVIVVSGDRIADVGPASTVKIPAGARVIDLSFATVLPGLIDGHVHLTDGKGDQMAEAKKATHDSLNAGFTTLVPQGSHGGAYTDVDLQKQIDSGKAVGPRLITAGPIVGQELAAKGPDQFRRALDELHAHGAMHAKIVPNTTYSWDKQGKMSNTNVVSLEELKAAVEEAHKNGMFIATHSYGGPGLKYAIEAGVDDIQHATAADDDDIKTLVAKHLPVTSTILDLRQDEPADLLKWAPFSKFREMQKTWVKMMKAGVTLGFGSGATPVTNGAGRIFDTACQCSHGVQGEHLVVLTEWGATPAYVLRMATSVNAAILHKDNDLGSVEKGKLADIIATDGDPLQDITEIQNVKFVMKGGQVIKNELAPKPSSNQTR